ncbi:MAG: hypothetical protein ACRD2W_17730 [Acidimicrobiales bacterium]
MTHIVAMTRRRVAHMMLRSLLLPAITAILWLVTVTLSGAGPTGVSEPTTPTGTTAAYISAGSTGR